MAFQHPAIWQNILGLLVASPTTIYRLDRLEEPLLLAMLQTMTILPLMPFTIYMTVKAEFPCVK